MGDDSSPLLDIPEFDTVRSVFLDPMHLLYLRIMKWILRQLLGKNKVNRKCKLHRRDIKRMNAILKQLLKKAPEEFQRRKMDLDEFSHWKATQYRFFLHYCGVENASYARELLGKFFELLPSFYGTASKVINSHNLIHVADDVEFTKKFLTETSAFPFENFLGKIKRKIRGRKKPLAQLVRKESEEHACPKMTMKKALHMKKDIIINPDIFHEEAVDLKSVILRGVKLSTSKPNIIVKMDSNEIFQITRIGKEAHNIFVHGFAFKTVTDAFKFPCESTKLGIMKLGRLPRREKIVSLEKVLKKCVLFENGNNIFAVTFLHDP